MTKFPLPPREDIERVINTSLEEDLRDVGDVTTNSVVPENAQASARLVAKAEGVLAGLDIFLQVFAHVDPCLSFEKKAEDGDLLKVGQEIALVNGNARSLLVAERTALNIICRLSGVATAAKTYLDAIAGLPTKILDTRKTTPGMRTLEKYAVAVGGGTNHRIGLFDAILIKENHIAMGGGVIEAVKSARAASDLPVQLEVENMEELAQAIEVGADSVLLDNMTPEQTRIAVEFAKAKAPSSFLLESSGGITIKNVKDYAAAGVDRISIGALTHSVVALDMSLLIKEI